MKVTFRLCKKKRKKKKLIEPTIVTLCYSTNSTPKENIVIGHMTIDPIYNELDC